MINRKKGNILYKKGHKSEDSRQILLHIFTYPMVLVEFCLAIVHPTFAEANGILLNWRL